MVRTLQEPDGEEITIVEAAGRLRRYDGNVAVNLFGNLLGIPAGYEVSSSSYEPTIPHGPTEPSLT